MGCSLNGSSGKWDFKENNKKKIQKYFSQHKTFIIIKISYIIKVFYISRINLELQKFFIRHNKKEKIFPEIPVKEI